jgi:cobalamin biosynthesis Mg chelatase CobN
VVRHLYRTTRVYSAATILVLVFGLILADLQHDFAKWWVSVSITLFVVAAVLLILIMRDQRKAIIALETLSGSARGTSLTPAATAQAGIMERHPAAPALASPGPASIAAADSAAADSTDAADSTGAEDLAENGGTAGREGEGADGRKGRSANNEAAHVAAVERGRIASLSGIVGLIWLVTLVLMVYK